MKKINVLFLAVTFFIGASAIAQTDDSQIKMNTDDAVSTVSDNSDISGLMSQFINGVDASSFSAGETGKSEVLGMLSGVDATDYHKYALAVGSLTGALSSSSFQKDWSKNEEGLLYQLQNAVSVSDVAGAVLELSDMIDPSAYTKDFANEKDKWRSSLEAVSMTK